MLPDILQLVRKSKMKIRYYLLLSLFSILFASNSLVAQEGVSYFLHTVEKGQSLYSISSMYNVTQAQIISLNPGSDQKILAGQTLKIPQNRQKQPESERFHTIQAGETLYRLTVMYNISAKAITDANPGLTAENFKIGQVILIPGETGNTVTAFPEPTQPVVSTPALPEVKSRCREMHEVKRKETIFSVSRKYGITEEELIKANPELTSGMKKGSLLCIPYPVSQPVLPAVPVTSGQTPSNDELFAENSRKRENIPTVNAAIILPFLNNSKKSDTVRMLEYYEGLLIAVDSLKRTGISVNLYTYDSGNEHASIDPILRKPELKKMDVIFGPLYQSHIKPLSDFAKENHVRLVIPFTSRDNEVFNNPSIYQVNTPQSYLYSEVYDHFMLQFRNPNVIIINTPEDDRDKGEFIAGLKQELQLRNIPVKELSSNVDPELLLGATDPDKENIFIPTSGTNITLNRILPYLTLVRRENPELTLHLFGYPEWQTYTNDHIDAFFELDTYFYSSFYTNNLFPAALNFTRAYHSWYEKEMGNTYPKYGMLGFDTGFFFIKGLHSYGSDFEDKLNSIAIRPIQTGFKFQRVNNWGGFINRKVFFVRFSPDYELIKIDFE